MAVVDPFELPTVEPREIPLPALPKPLTEIASKAQALSIVERVAEHYERQRRWKPSKTLNLLLFSAIHWFVRNKHIWPPAVSMALAKALDVYDRIENKSRAGLAAQYDGRADAMAELGLKQSLGLLRRKPTAGQMSYRFSKRKLSIRALPRFLAKELKKGQRSVAITSGLLTRAMNSSAAERSVRVSPRKIESWRSLPGYKSRRKMAKESWLQLLRGKCSLAAHMENLQSGLAALDGVVDDRAAEWAVASGKLTSDERLVVFKCISGMNRADRRLECKQLQALAGALRLGPIGPQKVRAAGHN